MPRLSHLIAAAAIVGIAVLPLALSHRHAGAFSYIENGSFENGVDGWHSGSLDLTTVAATEVTPVAGAMSARVTAEGGPFAVSQTLFDVPPGTYSVSVSVRRATADSQIFLRAQAINPEGPGSPDSYASSGTNIWIELGGEITLTSYSQVEVAVKGTGSGAIYIDDVHFDGAAPITATRTLPATATPLGTSTPVPTGTRTTTPTKTATPAAPAIGAALRNTGFEDVDDAGVPSAWDRYGGSLSLVAAPVRSGERAARFESATSSTKWIWQAVTVDPSGAYAFDAWVSDDDPAVASASLRISWYESADGSGAALATSDSTERLDAPAAGYRYLTTGAVLAPGSANSARLRVLLAPVSAAQAVIYIDDTSFAPAAPDTVSATAVAASASGDEAAVHDVAASTTAHGRSSKSTTLAPPAGGGIGVPSGSRVVINEVLYDPAGTEPDAAAEWVELYNAGNEPADLTHWSLADAAAVDELPDLLLPQHGYAIVAASDRFLKAYPSFTGTLVTVAGRIGNSLGNDGDRLLLRDPSGTVFDAISWGTDTSVLSPAIQDVPAGHSIERKSAGVDTDTASDFIDNESPSPGGPIAPVSSQPHPKAATDSPVKIASASSRSLTNWLPWTLAGVSAIALVAMLSWRIVPALTQRLHIRA